MPSVNLSEEEWQQIIRVLSQAPWNIANPLLMKISDQLRRNLETNRQEHESGPIPLRQ